MTKYEEYQLDWMKEHGYTLKDFTEAILECYEYCKDCSSTDKTVEATDTFTVLLDSGFKNCELFSSEKEWETNEGAKGFKEFTVTCYKQTKTYKEYQRADVIKEYEEAMLMCEGGEKDRYCNIWNDLTLGRKHCKDIIE